MCQDDDAADDASDTEDFEIKPADNLIPVGHVEGDAEGILQELNLSSELVICHKKEQCVYSNKYQLSRLCIYVKVLFYNVLH